MCLNQGRNKILRFLQKINVFKGCNYYFKNYHTKCNNNNSCLFFA